MFLFFTFWACSLMASWVTTFLGCSLATIYCLPQHIAYHIGGEAKPSVVHHVVPERACKNMAYPGPSSCLIHRSAWNRYSRKSISRILHSPTPIRGCRTPAGGELLSEPGLKSTQMVYGGSVALGYDPLSGLIALPG